MGAESSRPAERGPEATNDQELLLLIASTGEVVDESPTVVQSMKDAAARLKQRVLGIPGVKQAVIFSKRILVPWDTVSDIMLVNKLLDPRRDPCWFAVAVFNIVGPLMVVWVVQYKVSIRTLRSTCCNHPAVNALYWGLGLPGWFLADFYLILAYPFSEIDTELLGNTEMLRAIIEVILESLPQSTFQVYLCLRLHSLGRGDELPISELLFSVIPAYLNILRNLYDVYDTARNRYHIPVTTYIQELVSIPLGLSDNPPMMFLLGQRVCVSYDGIGDLNDSQAGIIAEKIGDVSNRTQVGIVFRFNNMSDEAARRIVMAVTKCETLRSIHMDKSVSFSKADIEELKKAHEISPVKLQLSGVALRDAVDADTVKGSGMVENWSKMALAGAVAIDAFASPGWDYNTMRTSAEASTAWITQNPGVRVMSPQLWLDASTLDGTSLQDGGVVQWKCLCSGRTLVGAEGELPQYKKYGDAAAVSFGYFHWGRLEPRVVRVGSIVSVHKFCPTRTRDSGNKADNFYMLCGSQSYDFHGNSYSAGASIAHLSHAHPLFRSAHVYLDGDEQLVKDAHYWEDFKVAAVLFDSGILDCNDRTADRIGRDRTNHEFCGEIAELIVFGDVLTPDQLASVTETLRRKWAKLL